MVYDYTSVALRARGVSPDDRAELEARYDPNDALPLKLAEHEYSNVHLEIDVHVYSPSGERNVQIVLPTTYAEVAAFHADRSDWNEVVRALVPAEHRFPYRVLVNVGNGLLALSRATCKDPSNAYWRSFVETAFAIALGIMMRPGSSITAIDEVAKVLLENLGTPADIDGDRN